MKQAIEPADPQDMPDSTGTLDDVIRGGADVRDGRAVVDLVGLGVVPDTSEQLVKTAFQERIKNDLPDQGDNGGVARLKQGRDMLLKS